MGSTLNQPSFVGGELAKVYARGDGDSDLDLYVYDERGNLIGQLRSVTLSSGDHYDKCREKYGSHQDWFNRSRFAGRRSASCR